ncbi:2,3-diaminopropionate biosynthesis protein SbnB [Paenibacillus sp. YN15]|uniref:2,3-diaminopropionate biosynthesis protein SbnB n=1 Tax=Paenibacillus sp. YN15 TaxID=1742774 RepID=UPI000DCBF654|nr:2,3-diaminopropionate biosynthesis protein SbnB [Paenibacillus sp. YN15]RAU96143.1 2,3-diaminopropionate biosynthesis protein SbnB [Paenibacillus sp. YN15]
MLYLNDRDIRAVGLDWPALVDAMEAAVRIVDAGDYAQPIKPYLRYKNPRNRIIAMPAYMGGNVNAAGIKWIASFPDNIKSGLPRAHSVMVLNDPLTGEPSAILNSPLTSIIRTASVSGLMIRAYLQERPLAQIELGIVGWGPVGRLHYEMALALYGDRIGRVRIYDIRQVDLLKADVPAHYREKTEMAASWEEVYRRSDIFITCTVSDHRYINLSPVKSSLLLNVSLRDYQSEAVASVKAVIVDDWEEVCRENTDIERLHLEQGLTRSGIRTIADVVCRRELSGFAPTEPVLFCPMGMAVFDIATAVYYTERARKKGIGTELE